MPGKLKMLGPIVPPTDSRTTPLAPKKKAEVYNSPDFIRFRSTVLARAGYQCEHIDQLGRRCEKHRPGSRLYAHHRVELRDGGSLTDPGNGECLCAEHHQHRTMAARMQRHRG